MDPEMFARLMARLAARQAGVCSVEDGSEGQTGGGETTKKPGADPALSKLIFDTSKAVMAKHFKSDDFKASLAESIKASLAEALPEVLKGMGTGGAPPEGQQPPGGQQHVGNHPPANKADDPEWKAMQARQKELEEKLTKMHTEREAERSNRMRTEERGLVESQLRQSGVPDNRLRAALALIYGEMKAVGRNAEGEIVYKAQREGYVDEVSIQDGIKEFLGTEEGKAFLPPTQTHGAGMRGGSALAPRSTARPGQAAPAGQANGKMDRATALDILGNGLMHGMDRGDGA